MPEPSESFVRELKNIDKDLDVKWNKKIQRFMVHHKDRRGKVYPVMRVQYKDGSYKPLDKRTVDAMKYSNRLRHKRPQDILFEIDKENEDNELRKQKQIKDDGYAIAKDMPRGFVNIGGVPSHPQTP